MIFIFNLIDYCSNETKSIQILRHIKGKLSLDSWNESVFLRKFMPSIRIT